ncbi:hypothetical protein D9H64_19465 [Escherichia coli]|nr:hypothetical protein [Escherichia coli]
MLPSETMIWQPEFTDKTLSRKPGAVHCSPGTISISACTPGSRCIFSSPCSMSRKSSREPSCAGNEEYN